MNYSLEIKKENLQAHIDIEEDLAKRKNGLFTFTIRVHDGSITDYNVVEYVNVLMDYLKP